MLLYPTLLIVYSYNYFCLEIFFIHIRNLNFKSDLPNEIGVSRSFEKLEPYNILFAVKSGWKRCKTMVTPRLPNVKAFWLGSMLVGTADIIVGPSRLRMLA